MPISPSPGTKLSTEMEAGIKFSTRMATCYSDFSTAHHPKPSAPSYIPKAFFCKLSEKDISKKTNNHLGTKVEELFTPKELTVELITELSDDIKNHVEMRIQLLLLLLLLAYKTQYQFLKCSTILQMGKQVGAMTGSKTACAHASTITGLLCKKQGSDKTYKFLDKSFFDYYLNMTTLLPEGVNKVDSTLDLSTKQLGVETKLRDATIQTLNKVAKSTTTLTPLTAAEGILEEMKLRLKAMKKNDKGEIQQLVIKKYLKVVRNYKKNLKNIFLGLFSPKKPDVKVDPEFFCRVRDKMYKRMEKEACESPLAHVKKQIALVKRKEAITEDLSLLDGLAGEYAGDCAKSKSVQKKVQAYLKSTTAKQQARDTEAMKELQNGEKKEFPERLIKIRDICLEVIKEKNHAKIVKNAEKAATSYHPDNMSKILQNIMGVSKVNLTGVAKTFSKLCSESPKVKKFLKEYSKSVKDTQRKTDVAALKALKPKVKVESTFPKRLRPLYKTCLKIIREDKSKKEIAKADADYKPNQLPGIIRKAMSEISSQ